MRIATRLVTMALSSALVAWVSTPHAGAQQPGHGTHGAHAQHAAKEASGHSHEDCELHGGQVTMTEAHHFETSFSPDGVRIYVYSAEQVPRMLETATGRVTLRFKDGSIQEIPLRAQTPAEGEQTVYFCPMHQSVVQMEPGVCKQCGGMKLFAQDYLYAKADLSKVETGTLKATVRIEGLNGPESEVTFTESFAGTAPDATPESEGAQPGSSQHSHGH